MMPKIMYEDELAIPVSNLPDPFASFLNKKINANIASEVSVDDQEHNGRMRFLKM